MEKTIIEVPSGIRYISDWVDYKLPESRCIIDKKLCGCGYTHFCLNNEDNIILCSPRTSLIINKLEQNPHCHYFKADNVSGKKRIQSDSEESAAHYTLRTQINDLAKYMNCKKSRSEPVKILVTYDSLPKLISIFKHYEIPLNQFKVIIDEFQQIFEDARFKPDIELNLLDFLEKYCENVIFLSGTPMLDFYIEKVPFLNSIPYYKLQWDVPESSPTRITLIKTSNLEKTAMEIVKLYREGLAPPKIIDGVEYKPKEAVLYVNNVSMIVSVIKNTGLKASEVNIITSKTRDNLRKIKTCGSGFDFGTIPLAGQKHKLITFCTSTAYYGVDMYSESAKSYVFSSCNIKTMAVDISLEIPQIIGRQRLKRNVFRSDLTIYQSGSIMSASKEEFLLELNTKQKKTEHDIEIYNAVKSRCSEEVLNTHRSRLRNGIENGNYKDSYTSILKDTGEPMLNIVMMLADHRAWVLQNKIYSDDAIVQMNLENIGQLCSETEISYFIEMAISIPEFEKRMKFCVDYTKKYPKMTPYIPKEYAKYLTMAKESSSVRKDHLERKLRVKTTTDNAFNNPDFIFGVYKRIRCGEVYTKTYIKKLLNYVANALGYEGITLKAVNIHRICKVGNAKLMNQKTGKENMGYRIISFLYK